MTKAKALPPQNVLRELFNYVPETGKIYWKERDVERFASSAQARTWNARFAGKEAFCSKNGPYRRGTIFYVFYPVHRVIFKLLHGFDPVCVDHINGDTDDNRPENLRSVTQAENKKNQKRMKNNTSGTTGVRWNASNNKWLSDISFAGKTIVLGRFINKEEAVLARKAAEIKYGFHPNHDRVMAA